MALAVAVYGAVAAATHNMNGKYSVTTVDKVDAPFNDDYASKGHEYFDVWSPEIATTYGENFWTSMGNHPLPAHIIERFKGMLAALLPPPPPPPTRIGVRSARVMQADPPVRRSYR